MIDWQIISYDPDSRPKTNRDVVAMSPEGFAHITHWRSAYNVFSCQRKHEDSYGWKWAYLDDYEN